MKINITAEEKLQKALDEVQSRCKVRVVTAKDIIETLNGIAVPKSRLNGTKVYWDGAERFPSSYKYTPESTHWTAENVHGRWYVTNIYRYICPNRRTHSGKIEFSEDAKAWILSEASMI